MTSPIAGLQNTATAHTIRVHKHDHSNLSAIDAATPQTNDDGSFNLLIKSAISISLISMSISTLEALLTQNYSNKSVVGSYIAKPIT